MNNGKYVDLTGQRFGRLEVVCMAHRGNSGQIQWNCRCECGGHTVVPTYHLKSGHTQSCGCFRREVAVHNGKTAKHGMYGSKLYNVWHGIKQRCESPAHHSFDDYGGRGIGICTEWSNSFESFQAYVSQLPHFSEDGYSLDRIDNSGNYEPGNVRWATVHEQANNKRNNIVLTHNGESRSIAEWARLLGIDAGLIYNRIRYGWTASDALTRPIRGYIRRDNNGSK